VNGRFDAKHRGYFASERFAQNDLYGGSYNFTDLQSLNRYEYTKNDPVNFRDPSGLGIMSLLRKIGGWLKEGYPSRGGPSFDWGNGRRT